MVSSCQRWRGLSGNALKLIAAASMLIDHIGVILLPEVALLRIIGRLAFPIYAFMIAEGCAKTRNRLRYFLAVFSLGAACQVVYFLHDGALYMGILITFSLSILLIYALQALKEALFAAPKRLVRQLAAALAFLLLAGWGVRFEPVFHNRLRVLGLYAPGAGQRVQKAINRCATEL